MEVGKMTIETRRVTPLIVRCLQQVVSFLHTVFKG